SSLVRSGGGVNLSAFPNAVAIDRSQSYRRSVCTHAGANSRADCRPARGRCGAGGRQRKSPTGAAEYGIPRKTASPGASHWPASVSPPAVTIGGSFAAAAAQTQCALASASAGTTDRRLIAPLQVRRAAGSVLQEERPALREVDRHR